MGTTILLVDPDPRTRGRTAEVLEHAGFHVRAHGEPAAALEDAAAVEPDAIVWDRSSCEEGGPSSLRAYASRFPARSTPIVVLSPSDAPADVARTLEGGADDCLPKPIAPAVLVATLRARLRPRAASVLRGELAEVPFIRLMQLCHRTGLTGVLEVEGACVEFVAGALAPTHRAAAARLLGRREGAFALRARAVDVGQVPEAPRAAAPATASPLHPAGRLSGTPLDRLRAEGLERFLERDFAGAVQVWEEALRIDPRNEALSANLTVARRKRDTGASRRDALAPCP